MTKEKSWNGVSVRNPDAEEISRRRAEAIADWLKKHRYVLSEEYLNLTFSMKGSKVSVKRESTLEPFSTKEE